MMGYKQNGSYKRTMEHYDDMLTGREWWSRVYVRLVWRKDGNLLVRKVFDFVPDDFHGRLPDVPVDTTILTAGEYRRMKTAKIVGLGYSKEMIAIATLQKETEDTDNPSLVQGDVEELSYTDESFDYVLPMNGFQAFPDEDKAFAEIFRVLKPRDCFCGCLYVRGERRLGDVLVRRVLERKGLFHPPYDTFTEADSWLRGIYGGDVQTEKVESVCLFRCVKPQKTSSKKNNNPKT